MRYAAAMKPTGTRAHGADDIIATIVHVRIVQLPSNGKLVRTGLPGIA